MPLPDFGITGDLPPGIHRATRDEVLARFGAVGGQRGVCARRLSHVYELAQRTGHLQRLLFSVAMRVLNRVLTMWTLFW